MQIAYILFPLPNIILAHILVEKNQSNKASISQANCSVLFFKIHFKFPNYCLKCSTRMENKLSRQICLLISKYSKSCSQLLFTSECCMVYIIVLVNTVFYFIKSSSLVNNIALKALYYGKINIVLKRKR